MHLGEFAWLPPLIFAIATVVGTANADDAREIPRSIMRSFALLGLGVVLVGLAVHLLATVFSG